VKSNKPDISVTLGGLHLKNPVIAASGTFGYGDEYADIVDPSLLGGVVVKGLSLKPREGNPPPRIVETPSGMLNAIGLANIGVEAFIKEKLPWLRALDTTVIANIYGHSVSEYGEVASALRASDGVDALEVNISCPNVEMGGMAFGTDPEAAARVTEIVKQNTDKPVIVKLSPNVTDIVQIAKAVEAAGADIISLINTLTGMAIDVRARRARLANIYGGLSGPAIRPVAVYMVYQVARSVNLPVIGIGGIMEAVDALEFMIAGATAVQVGTASFVNPQAMLDIIDGLRQYCSENGISGLAEVVGSLEA